MLLPPGFTGKNKIIFVNTRPMVPYLDIGLLAKTAVWEGKVRKVTSRGESVTVWVSQGPPGVNKPLKPFSM